MRDIGILHYVQERFMVLQPQVSVLKPQHGRIDTGDFGNELGHVAQDSVIRKQCRTKTDWESQRVHRCDPRQSVSKH